MERRAKRRGWSEAERAALRPARDEAVLGEVRALLSNDGLAGRLRRLERMEHAARVWVNGHPVGAAAQHAHLYETYD